MSDLQQGDKVSWVETKTKGRGFNMSTKEGKVLSVDGEIVRVKYRGKELEMHRSRLRAENETGELTDFVRSMAS